jgi:hypothetical protein
MIIMVISVAQRTRVIGAQGINMISRGIKKIDFHSRYGGIKLYDLDIVNLF